MEAPEALKQPTKARQMAVKPTSKAYPQGSPKDREKAQRVNHEAKSRTKRQVQGLRQQTWSHLERG